MDHTYGFKVDSVIELDTKIKKFYLKKFSSNTKPIYRLKPLWVLQNFMIRAYAVMCVWWREVVCGVWCAVSAQLHG